MDEILKTKNIKQN